MSMIISVQIKKPLMWRSNHKTHPQRAGGAENPAEMRDGKWTMEGEVKAQAEYPRRRPTLPAENVLAFL